MRARYDTLGLLRGAWADGPTVRLSAIDQGFCRPVATAARPPLLERRWRRDYSCRHGESLERRRGGGVLRLPVGAPRLYLPPARPGALPGAPRRGQHLGQDAGPDLLRR